MPIIRPKCTARALATGRLPGSPRQTGQVRVLGGSPKESSQPQNIFVAVASCTWISRPMTGSNATVFEGPPACAPEGAGGCGVRSDSDMGGCSIKANALLERICGVEQTVLAESGAGDLQADGQALAEAAGDRDRGDAGKRHGNCAHVVEVHRQGIIGLLAED